MERTYSAEVRDALLQYGESAIRTPLNIPFAEGNSNMVSASVLDLRQARLVKNKNTFNAVGSRVLERSTVHPTHLPVLDVDGGAKMSEVRRPGYTSYRLFMQAHSSRRGVYSPDSLLPELLGDYEMSYEVFQSPRGRAESRYGVDPRRINHSINTKISDFKTLGVQSIMLRSRRFPIFDVVDSTTNGHSHAFINKEFSKGDHSLLLQEFTALGILSEAWTKLAEQEGMGVVRTPWTEKKIKHVGYKI